MSIEGIGQLKQAIDTNDLDRVTTLMTRLSSLICSVAGLTV